MKRLPEVDVSNRRTQERRDLAQWLAEWRADIVLAMEDDTGPAADSCARPDSSPTALELPQAGQIRLLWPERLPTRTGPRYLAVLRARESGGWLVSPFSRFATPAWPGEWIAPDGRPPLRVLCVWNTRTISTPLLARSWVVGALAPSVADSAWRGHTHWAQAAGLPADLAAEAGPDIVHPLDPRREYLEEEGAWMDAVCREPRAAMDYAQGTCENARDLWLAAEDRGSYDAGATPPPDHPPIGPAV